MTRRGSVGEKPLEKLVRDRKRQSVRGVELRWGRSDLELLEFLSGVDAGLWLAREAAELNSGRQPHE